MEWTPISLHDLEKLIAEGIENMDDAVLDAWNAISIKPEKWSCSPWGDLGGGFWVVALMDDSVVWFNDIEDGFAVSRFTHPGTIDTYSASDLTFESFLLSLPEAEAAEDWGDVAPATEVPPELQSGGTIVRRQTTYWEVRSPQGNLWRVSFRGMEEARFVGRSFEQMALYDTHPLLVQYVEPWASLYFSGMPSNPEQAMSALAERVQEATDGWRSLDEYLNSGRDSRLGHGLLMRSPVSLANLAAEVFGVDATLIPVGRAERQLRVLAMDRSAILAEEFRFEHRGE